MRNLLKLQALVVIMITTLFVSCSSDENFESLENNAVSPDKELVYEMEFNAPVPGFDGLSSRATSWTNGSEVYLVFKNGSSYIYGKATYNSSTSKWSVSTNSTIPATSTATQVTAYYIENPQSTNGNTVTLSSSSIPYKGVGTYTSSSSSIYVTVTMDPCCGRLRLKGTSGTTVTLKSDANMISSYDSFNTNNCTFSNTKKDISLSVKSTGYTDYIYGYFDYVSGTNRTITVTTDATYERKDIASSAMADGQSSCLTVPTKSNYQSLGWTLVGSSIDKNAYVTPNLLLPFTDGYCTNWTIGSTAKTFYYDYYTNLSSSKTDDALVAELLKNSDAYDVEDYDNAILRHNDNSIFNSTSDTYTIVSVAYNSNGQRGPVNKYSFKIKSSTLPVATLSNLKLNSDSEENYWTFDVSMKNGATKYYFKYWDDATDVATDDSFLAWYMYHEIKEGKNTDKYDIEKARLGRSTSTIAIMTYAVNSKNEIGNFSIIRYPASSSAKHPKKSVGSRTKTIDDNKDIISVPKIIPRRLKEYNIHQFKIK